MDTAGRWPEGSVQRIAHALVLALAQAVLVFVVGLGVLGAALLGDADPFSAPPRVFALVVPLMLVETPLVIGVGLSWLGRLSLRQLGWRFDAAQLPWAAVALAGCLLTLAGALLLAGGELTEALSAIAAYTPSQRLLFALIGLHAAFTEESLFRGYLQPALVKRLGPSGGLALTACVFAVYHLNFRPLALVPKLVNGLVFGAVRQHTGSLWPGALGHGVFWAIVGAL